MNEAADLSVYKEALLFLVTAGVVAPLFFRLRVSPVLGYVLAGVALGPYGLGAVAERRPGSAHFAINVEGIDRSPGSASSCSCSRWGSNFRSSGCGACAGWCSASGFAQVVVTMLVLAAAAWRFGPARPRRCAVGAALAMSSTAIVIPMLVESKRLHRARAARVFAVLLFQDLAVAPLLVMVARSRPEASRASRWRLLSDARPRRARARPRWSFSGAWRCGRSFTSSPRPTAPSSSWPPASWWSWAPGWRAAASHLSMALGALRRRAAAGRDRIPPRDRGDDRAVQGPAARALFRLGRRGDQSRRHPRAAVAHPRPCRRRSSRSRGSCFSRSARAFRPARGRPAKWRCCSGRAASSAS